MIKRYNECFATKTGNCSKKASKYLRGLIQSNKGNMSAMAEVIPDTNSQSLQHFISYSPFDEEKLKKQINEDANNKLGGKEAGLLIDDSGTPKAGNRSAGVARQYCGKLGKVENCQVGVFATLAKRSSYAMVDAQLYLPEEWADDKDRMEEAGVPDNIEFKTKIAIAEGIIEDAKTRLEFGWVGFDAGYGKSKDFLYKIGDKNLIFMADIPTKMHVYNEEPKIIEREYTRKGKKFKKLVATIKPIKASEVIENNKNDISLVKIREGTKGTISANAMSKKVWIWYEKSKNSREMHLVYREDHSNPTDKKYSLSNASQDASLEALLKMQAHRYWVERPFQEAKNTVGMDQYQCRLWAAWHRHMLLVMLAMLFMMEQKIVYGEPSNLLSCRDIVQVLAKVLPRKDRTVEDVISIIDERHKKRELAIKYHYKSSSPQGP